MQSPGPTTTSFAVVQADAVSFETLVVACYTRIWRFCTASVYVYLEIVTNI